MQDSSDPPAPPPPDPGTPAQDATSREQLFALVYDRLREIAAHQLAHERPNHTLQATALVHEAWLKLAGQAPRGRYAIDRGAFLGAAAEAMRRILVDHARGRNRNKRGKGLIRVPLDPMEIAARDDAWEIDALDAAFDDLARRDERLAEIAKLRVFTGMSTEEIAEALGVHARTVRRDWQLARAVLHRSLNLPVAPDVDSTGPGRIPPEQV